jgi:hypothetical protein
VTASLITLCAAVSGFLTAVDAILGGGGGLAAKKVNQTVKNPATIRMSATTNVTTKPSL